MDYTFSYGKGENCIQIVSLGTPLENGLVGMATSELFRENIALVVDYDSVEGLDYDFACLTHYKSVDHYAVHMEEAIYNGIRSQDAMALTTLFHELGHYYYNDLEKPGCLKSYDEQRNFSVLHGRVNNHELIADSFAVEYLGTEIVIKGLQELKKAISERYDDERDSESFKFNQQELQYRMDRFV